MVGAQNGGDAARGSGGVRALGFGDEPVIRHAQTAQVVAADLAFAEAGISPGAPGSDHHGSQTAAEEFGSVVQTRFEDRRGAAAVLCRAKDDNRVGGAQFVAAGPFDHASVQCRSVDHGCEQQPQRPSFEKTRRHQSRNSASSLSGIAPWRRMVVLSPLMSTMVEATSRGLAPPSTIRPMRPPSCWRTPSAVVHSLAPLMLAEVAVIGTPAARITSTGIRAAGTRRATLPVLAVTFNGRREEAFTMMVSGPGQYLPVIW